MDSLFLILLLASLVSLVVGLVKPTLFSRFLGERSTRKYITIIFSALAVLFFILFGLFSTLSGIVEPSQDTSGNVENTQPETSNETVQQPSPTYAEAANWEKSGRTWRAIVFSSKPSNSQLIAAAKELHKKYPTGYFQFFDNGDKVEEFKNWDVNYGKVRDRDGEAKYSTDCDDISYCISLQNSGQEAYPFPEEWAEKHELGMLNEMFSDGSLKWQLSTPLGEKLADL